MKKSIILKWVGLALASLGIAMSSTSSSALANKESPDMRVASRGGLYVYEAANDAFWFAIGGRANFDETLFMGKGTNRANVSPTGGNAFPSGALIETAFLKFSGGIGCDWTYNLTLSFLPPTQIPFETFSSTSNSGFSRSVDFEDAWVNYQFWECANIRAGQFTPPTSVDDLGRYGTMNDTQFLRVALDTQTFSVPGKVLGIWVDSTFFDMFYFSLAAYQPRQPAGIASFSTPNNYFDPQANDRVGVSGRLTFVPIHADECVFHLGAIGRYQQLNSTSVGTGTPVIQQNLFFTTPEALTRNTAALVNTGSGLRAKSYGVWTGEALGIYGPFSAEGEFHWANVQQVGNPSPRFWGWHAQAGYVFTGEARQYDFFTGSVQDPIPCNEWGAWELAVRYSQVNLNSKNIHGGRENNVTLGLNWFINPNVHMSANYIWARIEPASATFTNASATPGKRNLNILALRIGAKF